MTTEQSGVRFNKSIAAKKRRKKVIVRLENQLVSGKKTIKSDTVELTTNDVKRINKELTVLKERI